MVLLTKKIINYKPPIKARLVMQKHTDRDILYRTILEAIRNSSFTVIGIILPELETEGPKDNLIIPFDPSEFDELQKDIQHLRYLFLRLSLPPFTAECHNQYFIHFIDRMCHLLTKLIKLDKDGIYSENPVLAEEITKLRHLVYGIIWTNYNIKHKINGITKNQHYKNLFRSPIRYAKAYYDRH